MADGIKIRFEFEPKNFVGVIDAISSPIALACTGAVREIGEAIKAKGRAAIASNGFGSKWQNALRVNYYPSKNRGKVGLPSIDAAAFVFHKIDYSSVFDKPTVVSGKPLLWIPLEGAMKPIKGVKGPRELKAKGVDLVSMKGTKPLLGVSVRQGKKASTAGGPLSLTKLKKGTDGKRGVVTTVPLFVGVPAVKLKRNFGIEGIARTEAAGLQTAYDRNVAALPTSEKG